MLIPQDAQKSVIDTEEEGALLSEQENVDELGNIPDEEFDDELFYGSDIESKERERRTSRHNAVKYNAFRQNE